MGLNTTSLHENKCSGEGRDVIRRVEATLGCSSTNGGWVAAGATLRRAPLGNGSFPARVNR